ncbi:MAG: DUF922 domain-containing protein [Flavobacteriaceae bacterium]|nr:DUF922 domain-containing protein [Flavobacteriaceae bacterium]
MILFYLWIWVVFTGFQEEPTLSWSAEYRLEWSDFRGEPEDRADVVAVTASGLTYGYSTTEYPSGDITYDIDVTAFFYPERSWYMEDEVTDIVLDHERLHFDITELHARKFRERVKNTTFSRNINREIDDISKAVHKELRSMQRKYDSETNYSRLPDKQILWNEFIRTELKKMEDYR